MEVSNVTLIPTQLGAFEGRPNTVLKLSVPTKHLLNEYLHWLTHDRQDFKACCPQNYKLKYKTEKAVCRSS